MGHEIQYILEAKRLVWLVAVVFAVVIMFQYFEFPYGDVSSSLFSASRAHPPQPSFQFQESLANTQFDDFNHTNHVDTIEKGNDFDSDEFTKKDGIVNGTSIIQENVTDAASPIGDFLLPPASSPVSPLIAPSTGLDEREIKPDINPPNSEKSVLSADDSHVNTAPPADDSHVNTAPPTDDSHVNTAPPADDSHVNTAPPTDDSHVNKADDSHVNTASSTDDSHVNTAPPVKESHEITMGDVVTVSDMHKILAHNRAFVRSPKPLWPSFVDQELLDAKSQIENAPANYNDRALYSPLYQNVSRFKRSYELMEKILKVYIYKEGDRPIFHKPESVLSGIYASEGWFMKHMKENRHFVTDDPEKAHLFYIPFSSRMLEEKLYVVGSGSRDNLVQHLKDYVQLISGRYGAWNRTGGADHFLVACHDWATDETKKSLNNCIRALCNSDVKNEGFELGKDVSLVETYVRSSQNPLRELGGKPPSQRPYLAFFAGQLHGNTRQILLQYWENKDPQMKIFGKLKKSKNKKSYISYMKSSKYCICAKGYEVNSPRVVEAIFHECVPVIVSDNFVPPFFEILNWESFAVFVLEKDIPNLKNILLGISQRRYLVMQQRVKRVQQHFLWHLKPVKYDLFHMILHSVWYNRVFRVGDSLE